MGKRAAILQSNYIPWKGYFDLIAAVDTFILYDDVQFTKNDWRNRNKIKTPQGTQWLSIPVGQSIHRRIRDVEFTDRTWLNKHWKSIQANYSRAKYFDELAPIIEPMYMTCKHQHLSTFNREFIEVICKYLGIQTEIKYSWEYNYWSEDDKTERLVILCQRAECSEYISGPAAKAYMNTSRFTDRGIGVTWFDYSNYPEYPQLWGDFVHQVSILDLLFNCGKRAPDYMKHVKQK